MRHRNVNVAAIGLIGLLCGMLTLAACGGGNGGRAKATPTATPPSTASILTSVKNANLRDATFTETEKLTSASGTFTSSGHGVMTLHPFKEQVISNGTVNGQQQQSTTIYDGQNFYSKSSSSAQWTKVPAGSQTNQAAATSSAASFGDLPNAQLVGSDTVNGVSTWHLRGSGTQASNGKTVNYTKDLWVRKDNYQPVKIVEHATGQQGTLDETISFTAWNTGATVNPPPASQITGG